jgi:hypothetical protein
MQFVKDHLVGLGPKNVLVRTALRMHGFRRGFSVGFANDAISLRKAQREMILNKAQYVQVPIMMECYNLFFDTIEGQTTGGRTILDFSRPGIQPSIQEDDVMDAYTRGYAPRPGDVTWDAGRGCGDASAHLLAQMVVANESNHRVDGGLTWKPLEKLFSSIGCEVWSSDKFSQMFTWANPVS